MSEMYESDRYYESQDSESNESYSSSDFDDWECYYCSTDLEHDLGTPFHDTESAIPRWYCSSCMLHIHQSDIEGDDD
jgi:hypothetical protein